MNLTLSKISEISKDESPVFILGVPRSGTTLMYTILLEHSAFKSQAINERKISLTTESKAFSYAHVVYSSENADRYLLQNQKIKNQFLDSIKNIKSYQKLGNFFYKSLLKSNNSNAILRKVAYIIGLNHIVLRSYFYHAKIARNVTRIIEKTPDHIDRLPEIKATFPNAKYIFIYRHPIDVLSSYRKRLKISMEGKNKSGGLNWLKLSPEDFCKRYQKYIDLAFKEKTNNPKNFMLIKYENLTANAYETLQEICNFLQEAFEETIIPTNESPGKEDRFSPFLGGKIVQHTKKWENFLNEDDSRLVEDILSKLMKQLNYPRYTN